MKYQGVLPFDENYAWSALVKQAMKLSQGEKITYYGIENKKITLRKLIRDRFLVTSYSFAALKGQIFYENGLKFREVEFMSTILKGVEKHQHIYEKSATKAVKWNKQVYRCKNPQCNHYTFAEFLEGKPAECFKCHESFIVPKEQLWKRNKHLVCVMCSKSPKKEAVSAGLNIMNDILFGLEQEEKDEND